ncbi:FAD-binding protein [Chloroflexi bacterium TSY]|nr:FAD-binding protein [Chloroflexi bacterium TSY]
MTHTWTNWAGSLSCQPNTIVQPTSEANLVALVKQADRTNVTIRVAGTGHSFVPLCLTDHLLISLDRLQGVVTTNSDTLEATVWAGTKIHQLGDPLLTAGMGMENMGDIDRQSIAGAISTGTHGTGRDLGSISTQVVGLRLILGDGELLDLRVEDDDERFKAAQVSLGALGMISQVTLRLLPAYRLHERTWAEPFDLVSDEAAYITGTGLLVDGGYTAQ